MTLTMRPLLYYRSISTPFSSWTRWSWRFQNSIAFGLLLVAFLLGSNGFSVESSQNDAGDPGQPLFLTPLIRSGDIDKAKSLSQVPAIGGLKILGYSGYFTVNETCNSNMFFWFFPAMNGDKKAPVLLWLQGGPGDTSMFGLFNEHGPLFIDKHGTAHTRNVTWASKYSIVYIDQPVGTGFSFTDKDECYARNEDDVARDLYSALSQFFTVFSEYQPNDFYATGESYAGKYVPAITYKIHQQNQGSPAVKINLKGMAIGNGLCDPESMLPAYAPYFYNIGLLDENQRDYFSSKSALAVKLIQAKKFSEAFRIFDRLLLGDLTATRSWLYNQTGLSNLYNYLLPVRPAEFLYYVGFVNQPLARKTIHVGSQSFNGSSNKVEEILSSGDGDNTARYQVAAILDADYKVLMYSGMLDIIVALPLTEAFLQAVPWNGLEGYKKATREIWKLNEGDVDVAGYVRTYENLIQVGVRGAGHIVPYDQPERAFQMLDTFITKEYN